MLKQYPTGQTREACLLAKCFDERIYREIVFLVDEVGILYRHCERGAFMRRTRQSSDGQRCGVFVG